MLITVCTCDKKETVTIKTPKDAVIDRTEWHVNFIITNYGCKRTRAQVTTIRETTENTFVFYGTYSAIDAYNQNVSGTFEGTGTYYPETQKASVDVEID